MIYVLDTKERLVPWLGGYVSNLVEGMSKITKVEVITDPVLMYGLNYRDALVIVDYNDLDKCIEMSKSMDKGSPKLVSHSHGTSAFLLGAKAYGDVDREKRQLNGVDLVCCNTHYQAKVMREAGYGKTAVTGYPISFDTIKAYGGQEKDRTILVGGRLEEDRQLFIAVEALEKYGKRVLFCCPHGKEHSARIYGWDSLTKYENIFRFKWNCSQEEFYKELAKASVVATFGCVDTLNLSVIEGYTLGCYPVVPRKMPYLEFLSDGYAPYSIADIQWMIDNQPEIRVKVDQYDMYEVGRRYVEEIKKLGVEV